jgi:hypothetical protein
MLVLSKSQAQSPRPSAEGCCESANRCLCKKGKAPRESAPARGAIWDQGREFVDFSKSLSISFVRYCLTIWYFLLAICADPWETNLKLAVCVMSLIELFFHYCRNSYGKLDLFDCAAGDTIFEILKIRNNNNVNWISIFDTCIISNRWNTNKKSEDTFIHDTINI